MAFLVLFAAFLVLAAPPVHVVGQRKGFVSIDCGLDASSGSYTDTQTGIEYEPDGPYIDAGAGENYRLSADYDIYLRRFQTLRSFPSGVRNCYALPTVAGTKYLLRAEFEYGNYDGKNSSSLEFDLHLGANYWRTAKLPEFKDEHEVIFVAWAGWAPFCLVNTGRGTPFVSVVELRPLVGSALLYPQAAPGLFSTMYKRLNMGTSSFIRYPDDQYDRFWSTVENANPRWVNLSAPAGSIQLDITSPVPSAVLQTAVAAAGNDTALTAITWHDDSKYSFTTLEHYADFQNTQLRQFDSYSGTVYESYKPPYLTRGTLYTESFKAADGNYSITLVATNTSVLPPMINALEIYLRVPYENPTTLPSDFDAIMAIKKEYGLTKNWMGDPCFPANFTWDGVKCGNTNGNTTRITSLNLSNSYLHGAVSKNFALLTALQNLNVSGNQLSDDSLCKNYTGSLIFRHDSSKRTCNKKITASRKNAVILVTSVVVAVLVVSAIVLAYFICRAKRKSTVSIDDHTRHAQLENAPRSRNLQDNENRWFTYKDLEKFTDNFKQFIGHGGFGVVYFGHLEDATEVAVKMRSESSSHGLDEFLAEVQSLTKVHHRNIVSLVDYCWEKDHLALVYEYMSQGNLYDHLRGVELGGGGRRRGEGQGGRAVPTDREQ